MRFFAAILLTTTLAFGQQKFSDLTGQLTIKGVKQQDFVEVPWLTWGGDVATFLANGSNEKTDPKSIYGQMGLNLKLVKGDDFIKQVSRYVEGESPYLRGTMRMLGIASEVVGSDPNTKPVVILQLTWSLGDHLVARSHVKTLNDLRPKQGKKVKIAVQQGGPHLDLIQDTLEAAGLKWEDVEIVWTKDLTGPNGAAELFRKDASMDACCVISPDMTGLTGGLESTGTGGEGTVKGAKVVNSTSTMSRSIADVYAVRSDYLKSNRADVEKFVAGYISATEKLVQMRKEFASSGKLTADYRNILNMAQVAFGKETIPTIEVDGHGLLTDALFVGLPGNISFFLDKGNLNNFENKLKLSLNLAVQRGYAKERFGFTHASWDYKKLATLANVPYVEPKISQRIDAESTKLFPDSANLDEKTIVSFDINFEPNEEEFSADVYATEFKRTIEQASRFGHAVVMVRGHSDPTKTLVHLIQAGMAKGIIKRTGVAGSYNYFLNGKPLDISQTKVMLQLIEKGAFEGVEPNPKETMQAAMNLSFARAKKVKAEIVRYAKSQGLNLDESQIQPIGAGIAEPIIARPKDINEAKSNMRVEFRVVRVSAEALKSSDFEY